MKNPTERFTGCHSLIVPNDDASRVVGIRLDPLTFRQVALLIIGDWETVNITTNIEVESIDLADHSRSGIHLWHVRVGNATIDISPSQVVYRFDMPLPKEVAKNE